MLTYNGFCLHFCLVVGLKPLTIIKYYTLRFSNVPE